MLTVTRLELAAICVPASWPRVSSDAILWTACIQLNKQSVVHDYTALGKFKNWANWSFLVFRFPYLFVAKVNTFLAVTYQSTLGRKFNLNTQTGKRNPLKARQQLPIALQWQTVPNSTGILGFSFRWYAASKTKNSITMIWHPFRHNSDELEVCSINGGQSRNSVARCWVKQRRSPLVLGFVGL